MSELIYVKKIENIVYEIYIYIHLLINELQYCILSIHYFISNNLPVIILLNYG